MAMFERLGRLIAQRPALCVGTWAMLLISAAVWGRLSPTAAPAEVGSFLPSGSPHNEASDIIKEALPAVWSNSMLAIIAQRDIGLTLSDFLWLDRVTNESRDQASRIIAAGTRAGDPPPAVHALS